MSRLKKMSIKKIMVSTFTLLVLFILYLLPNSSKEIEIQDGGLEYVYSNNLEVIYLLDSNDYVARTTIACNQSDEYERLKDLVSGLVIDGKKSNIIPNGFRSIIPTGTEILNISLENKIVIIDFSEDILEINQKYEDRMIEAIVYTLTSFEGIEGVIIKVEGEVLNKLPNSKKSLPNVLTKEYGINKSYEMTTLNDVSSYTVYYVNSYNDNNYYVPVTKYINNDNQDKIEVIINELSGSPIYESNLMSFLNVSAKLLDYEIIDNTIKLNFNNMILNDITSDNLLEEVVYTICLSINDNYDVDEVVFLVENEETLTISLKNIE